MAIPEKQMIILCVDDDKSVLLSLKTQLKSFYKDKYRYEMAYSANEAFELIKSLTADGFEVILVISDWLLQGMKGDEFLIQTHQKYPKINTVLLTGHANDSAIDNAKRHANLITCLNKPWSLEDLVNVINLAANKK